MDFFQLLFFFAVIVPSSIFHEYMHGWVANQLGDPTAKYAGRLTLNPIPHIDMWGTIILPIFLYVASAGSFLFAYAKPVPFNPYNLKYPKWGPAMVGIAGPLANLVIAFIFGFLAQQVNSFGFTVFAEVIVYANVLLAIFNLVPIPPLDGSKILFALMPESMHNVKVALERYGLIILFAFIFFGFTAISPVIFGLVRFFMGGV